MEKKKYYALMSEFSSALDRVDVEAVRKMIENGVNPNCVFATGDTPLHYAVERENQEMLELLLEKGALNGHRDENGMTALKCAYYDLVYTDSPFSRLAIRKIKAAERSSNRESTPEPRRASNPR